jgi:hypothetical protein
MTHIKRLFFYSYWGETESLGNVASTDLLYQPQMIFFINLLTVSCLKFYINYIT